ncbi:hypothetical protein TFLX_03755 [Thermoflexales bacterium]|nr:hypothetical protein TFLX_03755 [Thermoflexales bacterium]
MQRDLSLVSSCEQTIAILISIIAPHGIRLERSFDLRNALHDQSGCACPHHGTVQCTCQYVVLLAYEEAVNTPPAVLTVHECDGITRVRLAASEPGGNLSWSLLAALDEALNSVCAEI